MDDVYWEYKDEESNVFLYVYTTQIKGIKYNVEPIGVYSDNKGKAFALQFSVSKDSPEQVELFEILNMDESNKIKEKRNRKKKEAV